MSGKKRKETGLQQKAYVISPVRVWFKTVLHYSGLYLRKNIAVLFSPHGTSY